MSSCLAARVFVAMMSGAFVLLSACSSSPDNQDASPQASSQYDYSQAGFEQCLDESSIAYRKSDDGGLSIVDSTNPDVTEAVDRCTQLTSRPATDEGTRYQNAMTLAIADCLSDLGYHVTTSEGSGDLNDGNGNNIATYTVPEAERSSGSYNTDTDKCMQDATVAIPSPAGS